MSIRVSGPLDGAVIAGAVHSVVDRHELLRSVFRPTSTGLQQVILDSYVPDVPILEMSERA